MATPTLANLETTRVFTAGDRVLVRLSANPTHDQRRAIAHGVRKYLRADVRILQINCAEQRLAIDRGGVVIVLAGPEHVTHPGELGWANVSCKRVVFEDDDKLLFHDPRITSMPQAQEVMRYLREWAGPGVDIKIEWRHLA